MAPSVRPSCGTEDGFSLVEAMVAILIAGLVFSALGIAAISGVKGGVVARQSQQAADLANRALEHVRSLNYAGVSLLTTDVAGSPCPASGPDLGCVRPAAGGGFEHKVGATWEAVVAGSVGSLPQHSRR
jgi:type II secretory pathway pseudopilin PulG